MCVHNVGRRDDKKSFICDLCWLLFWTFLTWFKSLWELPSSCYDRKVSRLFFPNEKKLRNWLKEWWIVEKWIKIQQIRDSLSNY